MSQGRSTALLVLQGIRNVYRGGQRSLTTHLIASIVGEQRGARAPTSFSTVSTIFETLPLLDVRHKAIAFAMMFTVAILPAAKKHGGALLPASQDRCHHAGGSPSVENSHNP